MQKYSTVFDTIVQNSMKSTQQYIKQFGQPHCQQGLGTQDSNIVARFRTGIACHCLWSVNLACQIESRLPKIVHSFCLPIFHDIPKINEKFSKTLGFLRIPNVNLKLYYIFCFTNCLPHQRLMKKTNTCSPTSPSMFSSNAHTENKYLYI